MRTEFYHRNYELDTECIDPSTAKRVAIAALPFISLYKPAGNLLSSSMGTMRALSHYQKGETCQAYVAVLSVAATIFNDDAALLIVAIHDLAQTTYKACKDREHILDAISQGFYVAMLVKKTPEIALVAYLAQGAIQGYKSYMHIKKGEYIEASAKGLLVAVRGYGAYSQARKIYDRYVLLSDPLIAACYQRLVGQAVSHRLPTIPKMTPLGGHVTGFGQDLVKNNQLSFYKKNGRLELTFRVNHFARKQLENVIADYRNLDTGKFKKLTKITDKPSIAVSLDTPTDTAYDAKSPVHFFSLKNIGSISLGASLEEGPLRYNQVTVQADSIQKIHRLLSILDLHHAIDAARDEDIERMKIWHLFRTLYPRECYTMERSEEIFFLSPEALKTAIINMVPEMGINFEKDLPHMQLVEVMPGKSIYALTTVAKEANQLGTKYLYATMTGSGMSTVDRIVTITKLGMLSSDMRANLLDTPTHGMSSTKDFIVGSADRVFTRLSCRENMPYCFGVTFVISTDALNTGTYQYSSDCYGTRVTDTYASRLNIFEFIKGESRFPNTDNEVMIRDRIAPEMIQKILIRDQTLYDEIIQKLINDGLKTDHIQLAPNDTDGFWD